VELGRGDLAGLLSDLQHVDLLALADVVSPVADRDLLARALQDQEEVGHLDLRANARHRIVIEAFVDLLQEYDVFLLKELTNGAHTAIGLENATTLV